ncbi:DinB family protein [Metabacillus sp. 84]|uniref:DinB family protein n=1 Tax=unclassified Metabacillus TaxID=2675274 RepID=UPI003CF9BC6C
MLQYEIQPKMGYDQRIGELVCMLEHTRALTLQEGAKLSQAELDRRVSNGGNSIGALFTHIAAIETVHQLISFEGRSFNEEEDSIWGPALELGTKARQTIKGKSFDFYRSLFSETREKTLRKLQTKQDEWLYDKRTFPNGTLYNPYYLWFHVMEDEISHRGQIKMLKRQLGILDTEA